jgi:hypothetical protein
MTDPKSRVILEQKRLIKAYERLTEAILFHPIV